MFAEKTLFILGAGAGNDLGLPVGEELSVQIGKKLNFSIDDLGKIKGGDPKIAERIRLAARGKNEDSNLYFGACYRIARGIEYSRSIDEYINKHKEDGRVQFCAKLAIAQSIVEKEKGSHLFVDKQHGHRSFLRPSELSKSWMMQFVRILYEGIGRSEIDSVVDRISIINFNYDRSFEHYLYYTLQHSYGVGNQRAATALSKLRIVRPYGALGKLPWQVHGGLEYGGDMHDSTDLVKASSNVKTFYEQMQSDQDVSLMRSYMINAETIIFLGFGFHPQNVGLLRPDSKTSAKAIYATAFRESESSETEIRNTILTNFRNKDTCKTSSVFVHRSMDCRALLDEYFRTLTARL